MSHSVVVIGNGMVGHRFVELMRDRGSALTTFCEEPRLAYDRVNLSAYFAGKRADELALARLDEYRAAGVTVHVGDKAVAIDRARKLVRSAAGREVAYDKLVLATGSYPFVPPIPGRDARGAFVYRTLDDLDAIAAPAAAARVGVVIGGGLLGLEAANALVHLGLEVHVVELAPRLMSLQVDEVGGALLRARIERLGVRVRTGTSTRELVAGDGGGVACVRFSDGSELAADLVVFSAGIRPRDELARACGLAVGERGGIVVDDRCATSDPDVFAIGECALHDGRTYGLVAPGYRMARVAADAIAGSGGERFDTPDLATKLKLLGVDVASFGDAFAATPGARLVSFFDGNAEVYKKLVLSPDGTRLVGGILVGDASAYAELHALAAGKLPLPKHPETLVLPPRSDDDARAPRGRGVAALPAAATICSCLNVSKGAICDAIAGGHGSVAAVKACTQAGTGCGSCATLIGELVQHELARAGVAVVNHVCEHFPSSRQELYHLVRLHRIDSFDALLAAHGRGRGCEVCKPAVASILASAWNVAESWGLGDMFRRWRTPEAVFAILRELSRGRPCDLSGIESYAMLDERGGVQWPHPEGAPLPEVERRLFADGRFFHPDGKARLVFDQPRALPEPPDARYAFLLSTGRGSSSQWHTQTRTGKSAVLRRLHPQRLYVEVNPADARRLGIAPNDRVRIVSRRATIEARAFVTHSVAPGQLFLPMHFRETNRLTFAAFDPHSRQPAYKACAVALERLDTPPS